LNKGQLRFLIVDDHPSSRLILREMVAAYPSWRVVADANDGAMAVSLAAKYHPDVILMDVAMPGMNGLKATHQIKTTLPETRVILFSAYNNKGFHLASKNAGADCFIEKEKLTAQVLGDIIAQMVDPP